MRFWRRRVNVVEETRAFAEIRQLTTLKTISKTGGAGTKRVALARPGIVTSGRDASRGGHRELHPWLNVFYQVRTAIARRLCGRRSLRRIVIQVDMADFRHFSAMGSAGSGVPTHHAGQGTAVLRGLLSTCCGRSLVYFEPYFKEAS